MRKFLFTIVFLLLLAMAALFALRLYGDELTEIALVPQGEFVEQDALEANAYQDPAMWFSRPGMGALNDPARWQPVEAAAEISSPSLGNADVAPPPTLRPAPPTPDFAVFFVHPTSFLDGGRWNAPLDDAESQERARLMVRGMASAFNQASEIWVPRYRQATFGAFLSDSVAATSAIDAAYRDVEQAFDFFIQSVPDDRPIVLAGHSQGALHIMRLLGDRVADSDLEARIAMAYPIGWPISLEHDLPALGMPACATAGQADCVVSWASFAEPAEPGQFMRRYASTPGLDGEPRGDSTILCTNPLTGIMGGTAPIERNLGTLVPSDNLDGGELVAGAVPARCSNDGILLIGDAPEMGRYVLPGNNYHVYDIPLFWRNLQEDVARRLRARTPTSQDT